MFYKIVMRPAMTRGLSKITLNKKMEIKMLKWMCEVIRFDGNRNE